MLVPLMKPAHIALSLRLTCELNRKLRLGSLQEQVPEIVMGPQSHHIPFLVHTRTEARTIFHAKNSRPESAEGLSLFGTERWGPSLQEFTQQLVDMLELSQEQSSVVLALAMIYLDRASSVETSRSSGLPPCPFCSCQTVHSLLLSAACTAARVAGGRPVELSDEQLGMLGITARDISEMMAWMEGALGDLGYFVSMEEMQKFKTHWERAFLERQPGSPHDGHKNRHERTSSVPDHSVSADLQSSTGFHATHSSGTDGEQVASSEKDVRHYASNGFRPLPAFIVAKVHAA